MMGGEGEAKALNAVAESIAIDDFVMASSNSGFSTLNFEFVPPEATPLPSSPKYASGLRLPQHQINNEICAEIQVTLMWKSREEEPVPRVSVLLRWCFQPPIKQRH